MNLCPYCKQEMQVTPVGMLVEANTLYYKDRCLTLSQFSAKLLAVLIKGFGQPVPAGKLIDAVYEGNNIPIGVDNTMKTRISHLRKQLERFDRTLEIFTSHSYGYGLRLKVVSPTGDRLLNQLKTGAR